MVSIGKLLLDASHLFFDLVLFAGEEGHIFLEVDLDHLLERFVLLLKEEDFFFELLLGIHLTQ